MVVISAAHGSPEWALPWGLQAVANSILKTAQGEEPLWCAQLRAGTTSQPGEDAQGCAQSRLEELWAWRQILFLALKKTCHKNNCNNGFCNKIYVNDESVSWSPILTNEISSTCKFNCELMIIMWSLCLVQWLSNCIRGESSCTVLK